jgi:hypothetical protein
VAVPATLTDHIEPHRGDKAKFWDEANWQASCDWHHDQVKQRLERLFDQGKIGLPDLKLDSQKALAISLELDPRGGGQKF